MEPWNQTQIAIHRAGRATVVCGGGTRGGTPEPATVHIAEEQTPRGCDMTVSKSPHLNYYTAVLGKAGPLFAQSENREDLPAFGS